MIARMFKLRCSKIAKVGLLRRFWYNFIMITLQPVTENNWGATLQLTVHPTQQRFVAAFTPIAAIALAKAYIRPFGWHWLPYAIYADQQMVGFFAIALEPKQPADSWLFHFFIDQHRQGRGYGKQAMQTLIELIKTEQPTCTGISLVVHPANVVAQSLYQQSGFVATGEERWGEPVYRLKFA